ncbi:MAG TPA: hypothetical protein VK689_07010 [Armatimonadota bacterium]|nr:hypothetical protein [Armatimonadota bacterium]
MNKKHFSTQRPSAVRSRARARAGGSLLWRCTALFASLALLASQSPGGAQEIQVRLKDAPPEEISRELGAVLRAPVVIRGAVGKRVTLDLATAAPSVALDRVAALLGGTWRIRLHVRGSGPAPVPSGEGAQRPSTAALERNLALGLQDVSAARAFALVARELNADLETEGNLEARVKVQAVNAPASVLLDRIAEQATATWSYSFQIYAPDQPIPFVRPTRLPRPEPLTEARAQPIRLPSRSVRTPTVAVPSGTALRAALWEAVHFVVRAEPNRRPEAVRRFVASGEQLLAPLAQLSPAERQARRRTLLPVLAVWRRLFRGLAPVMQREVAPVTQLLERHLRA